MRSCARNSPIKHFLRIFEPFFENNNSHKVTNMEELLKNIDEQIAAFQTDSKLQQEKGNKAAGTRARKASLALEKLLNEFRKVSLEAGK